MTKGNVSRRTQLRVVRERTVETPEGKMLGVLIERGTPPEERRDFTRWVQAYRAVAATTDTTEVLSPCGHEVPRFDLTRPFAAMAERDSPQYPRSRLCPQCRVHPLRAALTRVGRSGDDPKEVQLASDWGSLTKAEREAATLLLHYLREVVPDLPDVAAWNRLTPQERHQVAQAGEAVARQLGLTFREFLSLKGEPAPAITAAGLRRLQASPTEKQRRAAARDDAAFRRQLARDRR